MIQALTHVVDYVRVSPCRKTHTIITVHIIITVDSSITNNNLVKKYLLKS